MHLAAHTHNLLQRNQSLNAILTNTRFSFNTQVISNNREEHVKSYIDEEIVTSTRADAFVKDHEYVIIQKYSPFSFTFLFGDFNYRIATESSNFSFDEIRRKVEDKRWTVLRMCDQLSNEMKRGKILTGYNEGTIDFAPTYKYLPGTNDYSCQEAKKKKKDAKHGIIRSEKVYDEKGKGKERIPSWTDRIFYRCNLQAGQIQQLYYGRTESLLSDHKPVSSVFITPVTNDAGEYVAPTRTFKKPPPIPSQLIRKSPEPSESVAGRTMNRTTIVAKPNLLSLDDFFSDETPFADDGSNLPPVPVINEGPVHQPNPNRFSSNFTQKPLQGTPPPRSVSPQVSKRSNTPPQHLQPPPQPYQQVSPQTQRGPPPTINKRSNTPPQMVQRVAPPTVTKRSNSRPELPTVPVLNNNPNMGLPPLPHTSNHPTQNMPPLPARRETPPDDYSQPVQYQPRQNVSPPQPQRQFEQQPRQQFDSQPRQSPQQRPVDNQPRQPITMRPNMRDMRQQQQTTNKTQPSFDPFEDDNFEWDIMETPNNVTQFYSRETIPQQQFEQQAPKRSVRGMVQTMNGAPTGRPLPKLPPDNFQ
jgi:hypothetical protein